MTMKLSPRDIWNEVKDYTIITLGLMCYAFGWTGFLVSNEIVTGGTTGLSALIFFGTKIPIPVTYFTINGILLIAAIRIIGWQYCIRSIFGVLMTTILLSIATVYIKEPLVKDEPFIVHHRRYHVGNRYRTGFHTQWQYGWNRYCRGHHQQIQTHYVGTQYPLLRLVHYIVIVSYFP